MQKGTTMRKQITRQLPARAHRLVVHAITRRLARMKLALARRIAPDLRELDQRVRETGEW